MSFFHSVKIVAHINVNGFVFETVGRFDGVNFHRTSLMNTRTQSQPYIKLSGANE